MRDCEASTETGLLSGEVLAIDYDRDVITVKVENQAQRDFAFELFDTSDVFRVGQRFSLKLDENGKPAEVVAAAGPEQARANEVSGYVESVDTEDALAWVYLRDDEGWHRKVMPLELFENNELASPGKHFLLEIDEHGTPLALRPDEQELEMQPQPQEDTKPRWTPRPAAEAEPQN